MMEGRLASWVARWGGWWWLVPVAVIVAAFRHSPGFGLLSDAAFLIEENLRLRGPGALWANLTHDYFWSSSGNTLPYWRPFTKAAWVIEYVLFGGWAGGFHLVQVGLHAIATVGVFFLARELGAARGWALAAGLWYGLHPALIEPVAMVMARSDVACAAGTIWAIQSWLRWRRTAGWRWAGLHVLALVFALGSKETAVVLAPLLTVAAFLRRDRPGEAAAALARENVQEGQGGQGGRLEVAGTPARENVPETRAGGVLDQSGWRARLLWIAPAWALTALYLAFRRVLLGKAAALAIDLDPIRIFLAGGRYLSGILPFRLESAIEPIARDPWLDSRVPATALLGWVLYAALLVFLWRRRYGQGLALALLVPFSLAPVLLVSELNVPVAASRYALADRWALLAIAAGTVLLALVGSSLSRRLVSYAAGLATALWVVATLVFSGRSHAPYRDTDTLAAFQDARYEATPERLRTLEDRCDHVERRMHQALRERTPEGALAEGRAAPAGCPHVGRFSLLRLVALTQLGRFSEASAMAATLDGQRLEPRYHGQAAYHAGLAHAELGDLSRAETEMRQASRLGYPSCNLPAQLGRLLARRNQLQPAAQEYERAAACSPRDPRPLLAAASLWAAAAQPIRARALLARIEPSTLPSELRATYEAVKAQTNRAGP